MLKPISMKITLLSIVMAFTLICCNKLTTPLIIGHRGAKGHVVENTLESIEKAKETSKHHRWKKFKKHRFLIENRILSIPNHFSDRLGTRGGVRNDLGYDSDDISRKLSLTVFRGR